MRLLIALAAGALAPLSFSPIDWWPLALVSVAIYYVLLADAAPRRAVWLSWCYGFGTFGVGASWVYVSIHDFGNAPPALAGVITLLFIAGIAFFFVLPAWLYRRFGSATFPALGFASTWVLGEWFRSWFLTGFPWLYLGSAHVTTLLSGVAPLFGVLGISFVLALSGALIGECYRRYRKLPSWVALGRSHLPTALALSWLAAIAPRNVAWTEASGSLDVGIVQPNIAQDLKFDDDEIENNLRKHSALSESLWGMDLVVWSETAIPFRYGDAITLIADLEELGLRHGTTLLTGIFAETDLGVHNSMAALGNGSGLWYKQKLVPFGEYMPLRSISRSVLELFSLPMSDIAPGPSEQGLLEANGHGIAPFICYEVVYPDFVRRYAADSELLVTISNDTWFGASWGPPQHLQMAAMRARENGRYMVRATNNGISALINERGEIFAQAPQFEEATLSGTVQLFTGRTPWSRWGDWPLLLLCGLLLVANFYQIRPLSPNPKTTAKS